MTEFAIIFLTFWIAVSTFALAIYAKPLIEKVIKVIYIKKELPSDHFVNLTKVSNDDFYQHFKKSWMSLKTIKARYVYNKEYFIIAWNDSPKYYYETKKEAVAAIKELRKEIKDPLMIIQDSSDNTFRIISKDKENKWL